MQISEAAFYTSQGLSLEAVRKDPLGDVPISASEVALNQESELQSGEATASFSEEASSKFHHHPIESCQNKNDDKRTRDVKSAVKELIANELTAMVEKALNEALHETLHNAQRDI